MTAVIAANDQTALATVEAVRERGLSVPEDVSLVRFDDTPSVRFANPASTAVPQPIADITAKAVERIIDACAGRAAVSAEPVVLPSTLIVRDSTRRPPTRQGTTA